MNELNLFFKGFLQGFRSFGHTITNIINFFLLLIVYIFGIGLVSALVYTFLLYISSSVLSFEGLYGILFFYGAGAVFGLFLLWCGLSRGILGRNIFYLLISTAAYALAVMICIRVTDIYNYRWGMILASSFGALVVVISLRILGYRITMVKCLGVIIPAVIIGLIVPQSDYGFGANGPNLWILFPLWQSMIGAYMGWVTQPSAEII